MISCPKYHFSAINLKYDELNVGQYIHSHLEAQPNEAAAETTNDGSDIEADIEKELESMKSSSTNQKKSYTFVRLEIACGTSYAVPYHSTRILLCATH